MRIGSVIIVLITFVFESCVENKPPFKPVLERVVSELRDSLKNEIGNKKLLSIEFNSDSHERNCDMKIFLSDCYASADIDGYAKIGSTTIAIYNLKDDHYEVVNKNNITFFTDTVVGFKDTCVMFMPKKQFFYSIYNEDSIKRISCYDDFPNLKSIRRPKCPNRVTFIVPIKDCFYWDSIQAEKEVEYYRNRGKTKRQ